MKHDDRGISSALVSILWLDWAVIRHRGAMMLKRPTQHPVKLARAHLTHRAGHRQS